MNRATVAPPTVICVRGPSRSGKTTVCEAVTRALAGRARVGWCKRTHHEIDLPQKSSGRLWSAGAAATVLRAADRIQVTLPSPNESVLDLLSALPAGLDLILLESHSPEAYPTLLSSSLDSEPDEEVIGRFTLEQAGAVGRKFAEAFLGCRMAGQPAARRRNDAGLPTVHRAWPALILANPGELQEVPA